MMSYFFAEQLLLRRPVKKPADYSTDPQLFLDDDFFRAAIRVATPAFYAVIAKKRFRLAELSAKEVYTIKKYINRYCFRPTPFGLFSSIALVSWSARPQQKFLPAKPVAHIRAEMALQNRLAERLLESDLREATSFEPNPSIYRVLSEYRFFRTGTDETGKLRTYQLQSIAFSKILKDLMTACTGGCPRKEIVAQISRATGCPSTEAEDYADFLIDSQLLVNQSRLAITGNDYLADLAVKLKNGKLKATLLSLSVQQTTENAIAVAGSIEKLEQQLDALLPEKSPIPHYLNIILQAEPSPISDLSAYQGDIRDGLSALELLSPSGRLPAMTRFIEAYQQHFEGQTLPLLVALDPEAGIGYQQPETEKNNPLLETLLIPHKPQPAQGGNWSAAHAVLMEAWLRDKSAGPQIRLNDDDLASLRSRHRTEQLLGMSVLFRVIDNKIYIENAGGINAPALMGRFTVADENLAAAAKSMARHLEEQNPGILFAELLHLSDPHIDNVNRRAHIYSYEIPVTSASTLPEAQQIQLSDLYIKVQDNMVLLFSEKHQKMVIPRLTSAYNHSLDKLPLFRFLADLPYQYGRSSLGLDLRGLFPDLRFYPRVEYKQAILSLATWMISEEQISRLTLNDPGKMTASFRKLSEEIRLSRYFSLAEGDQELVFDGQSSSDIQFFCHCVRNKKHAVIREFLDQTAVRQYNAYLLPSEPIVLPRFNQQTTKAGIQRKYMPGSEWLYLKVYAPKIGINRLLLRLSPLLHKRYGEHRIRQWFFIRYEDHAPHIRLRLQVNPDAISEVLVAFKTKLEDRIQQHVIREFQIDVYTRELERYTAGGIGNTENFFWASSELVLQFFKRGKGSGTAGTHAFALFSTLTIISAFITDAEEQAFFTLNSFQQFLPEFADRPFKIELDKKYRELAPGIMNAFGKADAGFLSGSVRSGRIFLKSLHNITGTITEKAKQTDYLRSIIHMHLNRIFTDESRKQEMICYYLLHKYLLSVKGRSRKHPPGNR